MKYSLLNSQLAADTELSVKNGMDLLDRLIKDIVSEEDIGDQFSLPRFIPLLSERIYTVNPFTRSFLVGWITVLDSVPHLELITYLPDFLDGLLGFVSDGNDDVRMSVTGILSEFLREIREISTLTLNSAADNNSSSQLELGAKTTSHRVTIAWTRLMQILLPHTRPLAPPQTQGIALMWMSEFILLAGLKIIHFVPDLVSVVLPCMAHNDPSIRRIAEHCDKSLRQLVTHSTVGDTENMSERFDYTATVNALTLQFSDVHEKTRVASLEWLLMLHKKAPKLVVSPESGTFPALLKTLSDSSDLVVKRDLQLLSQISALSSPAHFKTFISSILLLFSTDSALLELRGSLIVRQLCVELGGERIFCAFAEALEHEQDFEFANLMVVNLNWILMTSDEVSDVRRRLRALDHRENHFLFVAIYKSFCHNAIATLSLCLLAQAYDHSSALLQTFTELEMTVPLLIQADKLVQLLESPVFTYLRLQLLEPERYPSLYKSLYGILMILPQSSAFATLRNRLGSVGGLSMLQFMQPKTTTSLNVSGSPGSSRRTGAIAGDMAELKFNDLLSHFQAVQAKQEKARGHSQMQSQFKSSGQSGRIDGIELQSSLQGQTRIVGNRKSKSNVKVPSRNTKSMTMSSAESKNNPVSRYGRLGLTLRAPSKPPINGGGGGSVSVLPSVSRLSEESSTVETSSTPVTTQHLSKSPHLSATPPMVAMAGTSVNKVTAVRGTEIHSFPNLSSGGASVSSLGHALISALSMNEAVHDDEI